MELNRTGIIDRIKGGVTTIDDFNYDKLSAPPLSMLLSQYDIDSLYNIATSVRYSGNTRKKYKAIDDILTRRDFSKLSAGTNRLCYKFLHDDSFIIKVPYQSIALQDSPAEFANQFILKPFCTKVFEVDPCGVVGSFERVDPITSREEFVSIADDAFYLINDWLLSNGHIMADIGTQYFMNYGLRRGFGLVIIDFPYLYEIDGNKLFCTSPDSNSNTGICGGLINFDPGFNDLYCEKCGTMYRVKQISKEIKEERIIVKGGHKKMKVRIMVGGRDYKERNGSESIDGFKDAVPKVSTPTAQRVSSQKTTERPTSIPKVSVRPARGNNFQKSANNDEAKYTKPSKPNVSVNVGNKTPQSHGDDYHTVKAAEDSRGKSSISNNVPDSGKVQASIKVTDNVTAAEAQYVKETENKSKFSESPVVTDVKIVGDEEWIKILEDELHAAKTQIEELNIMKDDYKKSLDYYKAEHEKVVTKLKEKESNIGSLLVENKGYKKELADKDEKIKLLEEKIDSAADEIDNKNIEISNLESEIQKLRNELENDPYSEIDLSKYILLSKHETVMAEKDLKISELSAVITEQTRDISSFCSVISDVDDCILRPIMESDDKFETDNIKGTITLDATICYLSSMMKLDEDTVDLPVIGFKYKDGSWLCDADGHNVIATSIGGISLEWFIIEGGVYSLMEDDIYDKYFDFKEGTNVQETAEEEIEGVIDNAEDGNSGKN